MYNGGVNRLTRCPRPFCGGSILWGTCLLCGRDPTSPAHVGAHHQREPSARRAPREDPYLSLARRVLAPPERAPEWDPALGAYVIDETDA